jgi:hypothetical protein
VEKEVCVKYQKLLGRMCVTEDLTSNHDEQAKEEDHGQDDRDVATWGREESSSNDSSDEESETDEKKDADQDNAIFSDIEEEGSVVDDSDVASESTVKVMKVQPKNGNIYIKKEGENNKRKKNTMLRHSEAKPVSG